MLGRATPLLRNALCAALFVSVTAPAKSDADAGKILAGPALKAQAYKSREEMGRVWNDDGVAGAIALSAVCYDKLTAQSTASARTRCLVLDISGFKLEKATPEKFRKIDLEENDLFLRREANKADG